MESRPRQRESSKKGSIDNDKHLKVKQFAQTLQKSAAANVQDT